MLYTTGPAGTFIQLNLCYVIYLDYQPLTPAINARNHCCSRSVIKGLRNKMATFADQKNRIRRSMLNLLSLVCFSIMLCAVHSVESSSGFKVPKPTKTQAKWLDYEVGAIVHFNMQTFDRYMKPGKQLF